MERAASIPGASDLPYGQSGTQQSLAALGRDFIRRASHRYSRIGFCTIRFMMSVALAAVQLIIYSFILTDETRAQTLASLPATVQLLTSGNEA